MLGTPVLSMNSTMGPDMGITPLATFLSFCLTLRRDRRVFVVVLENAPYKPNSCPQVQELERRSCRTDQSTARRSAPHVSRCAGPADLRLGRLSDLRQCRHRK